MANLFTHLERPTLPLATVAPALVAVVGILASPPYTALLIHNIVLAVLGLALGMTMVCLGRLTGRRWRRDRRFACPACGHRQLRGERTDCPACGTLLFPSAPGASSVLPLGAFRGKLTTPRYHTLLWATGMAFVTYCVFLLPWTILQCTGREVGDLNIDFTDVVRAPPAMAFLSDPPGIGVCLLFVSQHAFIPIARSQGPFLDNPALLVAMYAGTFLILLAHWYVGLRRLRLGWLLPVGLAAANGLVAILGYVHRWFY